MNQKKGPDSWKQLFQEVEVVAAVIGVIGTIIGTLLISVLLSYMEGRLGLGAILGVVLFMLLVGIWILLAIRWGVRVAAGAAAVMMILGSAGFLAPNLDALNLEDEAASTARQPATTDTNTAAPAAITSTIATRTPRASPTPRPSPMSPTPAATAQPVPQPVASVAATPFVGRAGWTAFTNANDVRVLALQDDHVWAGGSGGLVRWNRHDGTYEKYTVDDGLVSNDVTALLADENGQLWAGTRSGISRFDGAGWENWTRDTGLPGDSGIGFAADGAGGLWIAFRDEGVSHYDPSVERWIDAWQTFGPAQGLPSDAVKTIARDADGRLWVGFYGQSIGVFDAAAGTWTPATELGLDLATGSALLDQQAGDVWIIAEDAVAALDVDAGQWETFPLPDELASAGIASRLRDSTGALWLGTGGTASLATTASGGCISTATPAWRTTLC